MALNHLDVFITRGLPKRPLPAILGSDGAGVVDAVGDSVENLHLGDEVVMYPIVTCGRCAACQAGQEVHCQKMAILGEHTDGTFQEALNVPAAICHPRPAHLSWEETAALPLAWLTAWRLLFTRGGLQAGDWLVLVGIGGGVATACLLLGKAHGLKVIVTSRDPDKRQRALALGADVALPSEGFSKAVQAATEGAGARAVVDTVGPATLDESLRSLGREGMVLTVGATSGPKVDLLLPRHVVPPPVADHLDDGQPQRVPQHARGRQHATSCGHPSIASSRWQKAPPRSPISKQASSSAKSSCQRSRRVLTKSHGLGNDYLVADPADLPFEVTPSGCGCCAIGMWALGRMGCWCSRAGWACASSTRTARRPKRAATGCASSPNGCTTLAAHRGERL